MTILTAAFVCVCVCVCVLTADCDRKILRGKGNRCIFCSVCSWVFCFCFFFFLFFLLSGCCFVWVWVFYSINLNRVLLSAACYLLHVPYHISTVKRRANMTDLCGTYSPISDKRAWQLSSYGVRLEQTQSKHSFTTPSK